MGWLGHGESCWWPFKSDPDCEECKEWDRIAREAELAAEARYRAGRAAKRKTTKRMPNA